MAKIRGGNGKDDLYGTSGDDVMYLGKNGDQAHGGKGNDHIFGGGGTDILYGGAGDDQLFGGSGNDVLFGGAGNDLLQGGDSPSDQYFGGSGADRFKFSAISDSQHFPPLIGDFRHSEGDKIDLSDIDANTNKAGNQSFTYIGTHAFSGHAGELRYHVFVDDPSAHTKSTFIEIDRDGDGHSDFIIQLNGAHPVHPVDLVL